jgi:uncharacterized protein YbjT (DUF2867 family)
LILVSGATGNVAVTSSDHESRSYRLSGPDSLLPADRVRSLGEVLGREQRFEGQSDVEAREETQSRVPHACDRGHSD